MFKDLIKKQKQMSESVRLADGFSDLKSIGGVDQAFSGDNVFSGIVVMRYNDLKTIEKQHAKMRANFPYVPGLLSFREGPVIVKAFQQLKNRPDVLFVNGCGVNHPRGIGLASHVGIELDIPTIGITQKRLCGDYIAPEKVGEHTGLHYKDKKVGYVLKTGKSYNPIFVAPGHRVSLEGSLSITRECVAGHKLPEPLWLAHKYVNEIKKG
jgi:deoxyribonuclease V